jgi:hypothetical protein
LARRYSIIGIPVHVFEIEFRLRLLLFSETNIIVIHRISLVESLLGDFNNSKKMYRNGCLYNIGEKPLVLADGQRTALNLDAHDQAVDAIVQEAIVTDARWYLGYDSSMGVDSLNATFIPQTRSSSSDQFLQIVEISVPFEARCWISGSPSILE